MKQFTAEQLRVLADQLAAESARRKALGSEVWLERVLRLDDNVVAFVVWDEGLGEFVAEFLEGEERGE